jgi:hypothetical protein
MQFVGSNVGFLVGKSDQPDNALGIVINSLGPLCRVCRVITTGESLTELVSTWDGLE